jgi:hypothetical protein
MNCSEEDLNLLKINVISPYLSAADSLPSPFANCLVPSPCTQKNQLILNLKAGVPSSS